MADSREFLQLDFDIVSEVLERFLKRMAPESRREMADVFAERVRQRCAFDGSGVLDAPRGLALGQDLDERGIAVLGPMIDRRQAAEARDFLLDQPCFNGHVIAASDQVGRSARDGARAFHYGSYRHEQVLRAPHLLELANHPTVLSAAARYLGCTPTMYSVNAWWSFAGHAEIAPAAQHFHRDYDDFRFCVLFVYLTDVADDGSPHLFIQETHDQRRLARRFADDPVVQSPSGAHLRQFLEELWAKNWHAHDPLAEQLLVQLLGDNIVRLDGPAGFTFLEDTHGFHKGVPPKSTDRLAFWARYGVSRGESVKINPMQPVAIETSGRLPDDPLHRFVNRRLIEFP